MLPGTWQWEDLEHFLCISTAITTMSRSNSGSSSSSSRALITEAAIMAPGAHQCGRRAGNSL